jgi:hypothetical protein
MIFMLLPSAYPQHQLQTPTFIHPLIFNALYGSMKEGVAIDVDKVTVLGETYTTAAPSEIALCTDQIVYVWLGRYFFYFCTADEKTDIEKKAAQQAEIEKQQDIDRRNAVRAAADTYYQQYDLPFTFEACIKDVLSGLSASSNGDGCKTNTVIHIRLNEDINIGRLNRRKGDFLCTTAQSGTNGQNYADQISDECWDGDGNKYTPAITCKQCMKLMEKYKKKDIDLIKEKK